ncbi:Glycosyl hydrolase family 98 putative carbohydrate binding module [Streptomyces bingchenggensis BCW-1]|uniref:Glycosyl hydrolase family 98 putative carbohydrate binding module n=1 Tax=Streptomyces bingchenggensis (strain BCW-1) TaxID=749414 RepID=D7BV54_STRBB|nr:MULTISPECIES: glycoside hydrolase family 97 protein [Streptomyces]ADI05433.1 Glycosyl hydrolase family 98 putative carbohydrate binding module [Streptomyces bingchenggensis BCW-1]
MPTLRPTNPPRHLLQRCLVALLLALAPLALPAYSAAAATNWTVTGPSAGSPTAAQVTLDNGTLTFAASSNGRTVLSPSPIGIRTSAADLTKDLTFLRRSDRTVTESYTMTTGKQRTQRTAYTETTLSFSGTGGARLDVVVRASDTGVAYRYVLPGSGSVTVTGEASSWTVPASADAWLVPPHSEDQGQWFATTAGGAPANTYRQPALFRVGGAYALVAETDLDGRYAASNLSHTSGSGTYTTQLEGGITTTLPLSTPWRTAALGDLASVTRSTIVDDLAAPSKVGDTSWIKPGAVAWSWLTEHGSPSSAARQKQYIDFAQRHGWEYVLIDEGWSSSWVPDVVSYAKARGVQVILWFNSSSLRTAQQRDQWLTQVRDWGVAGVKIDFIYEYTQPTLQWYDAVLSQTANLKLMVNFHGAAMPRGMQRTWPHVTTAEAVYGSEQFRNRAAFNTMLPYTRNAISSMDFTPVVFSMTGRDTTDAHELATGVVFESGWQHFADSPESYEAHPEALRILDQLPTAWDETRLLGGSPGKEAYVARRAGGRWYVGGISALSAKTFQTPLSFLGAGQWLAETVRDGSGGLTRETRVVSGSDTLSVPEAANGGFVTALCPYTSGMSTCSSQGQAGALKGSQSGLCADVPGTGQANGTQVALWDCHGQANQNWTASPTGQLTVFGGAKCLDVKGGAAADGTAVQIFDCNNSAGQRWTVNGDGTVVNPNSGKCLDATGGGTTTGTLLQIWTCNGGSNQTWYRANTTAAYKGKQSGRCLDLPGGNQANGTRPVLWDCNGGTNQTWFSTVSGELTVFANRCLEATGGATANGTPVQIYDCNGTYGQKWRVRSDGTIVNLGSGTCLDAIDAGTANGTRLQLWTCNGGANQVWTRS